MTEEQKQLFEKDPLVKLLIEKKCNYFVMLGGAVVDILEGRKPKDYDFSVILTTDLEKLNAEFLYTTKTADTYKVGNLLVQVLKTADTDFDFKISTSQLKFSGSKLNLSIDKMSFDKKILIPQPNSFELKKNALNSLKRIPHWKNKGYSIPDETYMSLLNVLGKSSNNS